MSKGIDASMRFMGPDERLPGLDQFWRCPKADCEFSMGGGSPAKLSPPRCPFHKVECEQVVEEGFYASPEGGS